MNVLGIVVPNENREASRRRLVIQTLRFDENSGECIWDFMRVNQENLAGLVERNEVIPVNFRMTQRGIRVDRLRNRKSSLKAAVKAVRKLMEVSYGSGAKLSGKCKEASELILAQMVKIDYPDAKLVNGYCIYDNHFYGKEIWFEEHTWIEVPSIHLIVDVTADQFNDGMDEENKFKPIILTLRLPNGLTHFKPVKGLR